MRIRSSGLAIALSASMLVASACSSSSTSSTSGGSGGGSTTTMANPNDPAINQWAITYTGGKPQKATGTPIKIGYVNQDSFFPEATIGVNAAVAYANAELNGADGHPINIIVVPGRHRVRRRQVRRADGERLVDQARADRHAARRQHRAVQRAQRQEGGDHRQRRDPGRLHDPGR